MQNKGNHSVHPHPAASLWPAMGKQELAALAADIKQHGLRQPVVMHNGTIIDGVHRLKACEMAGVAPRFVEYDGDASPEAILAYVASCNRHRRHLTSDQLAAVAVAADAYVQSLRVAAAKRRKSGKRESTIPNCLGKVADKHAGEVDQQLANMYGTNRRYVGALRTLKATSPDTFDAVHAGKKRLSAVLREQRTTEWMRRRIAVPGNLPKASDRYRLVASAIADATRHVEPASIDIIVTDPPYGEEYIPLYSDLSRFAQHALRPGGSLVCMTGQVYLPDVLSRLGEHLTYQWAISYHMARHQKARIWLRRVIVNWKPLLWFVKGTYTGDLVTDVIECPPDDGDKQHHEWGQSVVGMERIFERFSLPGQTVCDPFCGGGATGVAAVRLGRMFVGMDVDAHCVDVTAQRLADLAGKKK